jgi:hypothetical protein
MPPGSLSEIGERILLAAWKLNGLGERSVAEETLKAESSSDEEFARELSILEAQGFITRSSTLDRAEFTLTPLGLAILRQVEEDKLQELK